MDKLFSPEGRLNRLPYIGRWAATSGIAFVVSFIIAITIDPAVGQPSPLGLLILLGVMTAGTVSNVLQAIKRLHDLDRSGWHILLTLIPIYGLYIAGLIYFKKGSTGRNRYGP